MTFCTQTGSVAFRNLFGGGERLQVHASVGTRARSAVQIALTAPLRGNPNRVVDISVYKTVQDWSVLSGFSEHQRGLALSYKVRARQPSPPLPPRRRRP